MIATELHKIVEIYSRDGQTIVQLTDLGVVLIAGLIAAIAVQVFR